MSRPPRHAPGVEVLLTPPGGDAWIHFLPRYRAPKVITDTRSGMGKGDRRTRRGKINRSSYGKNRKRKVKKKTKTSTRAA